MATFETLSDIYALIAMSVKDEAKISFTAKQADDGGKGHSKSSNAVVTDSKRCCSITMSIAAASLAIRGMQRQGLLGRRIAQGHSGACDAHCDSSTPFGHRHAVFRTTVSGICHTGQND